MHGNKGNSNAKKANPANEWLQIRMTRDEKAQLKQKAERAGQSLSAYVRSQLFGGEA